MEEPLDGAARAATPRSRHDFGEIQVHSGGQAAKPSRTLNTGVSSAQASTLFGAAREIGQVATLKSAEEAASASLTPIVSVGPRLAETSPAAEGEGDAGDTGGVPDSGDTGALPDSADTGGSGTTTGAASPRILRVNVPATPGWASVTPNTTFLDLKEPREFPHFLKVREDVVTGSKTRITALEGRYLGYLLGGYDADIDTRLLTSAGPPTAAITCKFDYAAGEFWYGGAGPVAAKTDPTNPVPKGTHDIELPDFQHHLGSGYGDFATTWFRLGHSGDRYLHPGSESLGCATVTDTTEWPNIWRALITARKDERSVGELEVV
jgi:hypothetical protein